MKQILLFLLFVNGCTGFAQHNNDSVYQGPINLPTGNVIDGVFIHEHIPTKTGFCLYPAVEEFIWTKRVWRSIEPDSGKNQLFFAPLFLERNQLADVAPMSFWEVITTNSMNPGIGLYLPFHPVENSIVDGDNFKYPLKATGMDSNQFIQDLIEFKIFEPKAGPRKVKPRRTPPYDRIDAVEMGLICMEVEYEPQEVTWHGSEAISGYQIIEDWYFDKERSVLDVKPLGIGPVVSTNQPNQEKVHPLFWIYYPEWESVFCNYLVLNPDNSRGTLNVKNMFYSRKFESIIFRQTAVFNRAEDNYKTYLNAIIEYRDLQAKIKIVEEEIELFWLQ